VKLACEDCGATTGLSVRGSRLLCKKCVQAQPGRRCAAAIVRGYRQGGRCTRPASDGHSLCSSHLRIGAEALEWEPCPACGADRAVGQHCTRCARTNPVKARGDGAAFLRLPTAQPAIVVLSGAGAAALRRLRQRAPRLSDAELIAAALAAYSADTALPRPEGESA